MPRRWETCSDDAIRVQGLFTTLWQPVELDKRLPAFLVHQLEGVHPKARHVTVVEGDANIIVQEGELRRARHKWNQRTVQEQLQL